MALWLPRPILQTASRILGSPSSVPGMADEKTLSAILDFVGSAADGDILYRDTTWKRLAKGSDTNVLTLASGLPSWAAPGGGSGLWVEIGDTTVSSPVASVEFAWTPGTYAAVLAFADGLSHDDGSSRVISIHLRNSTTLLAIISGSSIAASVLQSMQAFWCVAGQGSTQANVGVGITCTSAAVSSAPLNICGTSTSVPDRVRFVSAAGNIDAGRCYAWGLLL